MEKKNNVGLIAIIAILIVALLGLSFYVAYDKGLIFNSEKNNEENDNQESVEQENSNEMVIQELSTKVDLLSSVRGIGSPIIENLYKEEKITYINEESKKIIAMRATKEESIKITGNAELATTVNSSAKKRGITEEYSSVCTNPVDPVNGCIGTTVKSKDEYVSMYHELFNEKLSVESYGNSAGYEVNWDVTDVCTIYYYVFGINKFIEHTGCGAILGYPGYGTVKDLEYNNKYTIDGDYAYVYRNIGYIDKNTNTNKIEVYSDYSKTKVVEELASEEAVSNYEIGEDNYTQFSEYKFTFKKNNDTGKYYFVSVEKISK